MSIEERNYLKRFLSSPDLSELLRGQKITIDNLGGDEQSVTIRIKNDQIASDLFIKLEVNPLLGNNPYSISLMKGDVVLVRYDRIQAIRLGDIRTANTINTVFDHERAFDLIEELQNITTKTSPHKNFNGIEGKAKLSYINPDHSQISAKIA